ncbi:hypothetical protein L915_21778 [Phytophthora nicotianae]|uniref:Uncharacterized protein n=1 Tax=Phytophthora nicotianae TaxID=4792 RepID=W2HUG4_PHYNI|nr:hypothetical protein L915_21778 [Phytophthora nicotianae]ETL25585.1 hypothetical protein L916_20582 [Phytophthora nicotianae]
MWKVAIKHVHELIKDPTKGNTTQQCSEKFRRCYGRPCVHEMIRVYQAEGVVVKEDAQRAAMVASVEML